ncbi:MAG: hypothetical protein GY756_14800 [bacterium]|nr:hypothetical protein [bacterium]
MNKIIALWTHPRTLSTAFSMLMKQRGDLNIIVEPFKFMYYEGFYRKDPKIFQ